MPLQSNPNGLPHKLPATVDELIDQLDGLYPPAVVRGPGFDRDRVLYEAGSRTVVDQLLALRRRQNGGQ